MNSPIISAIDVGTNSFHMMTASVDDNGIMNIISRDKEIVRLGSSSGDMRYLQRDAIKRAVTTLRAYAKLAIHENSQIRAVATSAVREAKNKDEFIELIKRETGVELEVVSGVEEARLIALGVVHALPILKEKCLIIDIGGGSTETIITQNSEMLHLQSTKIGAIRLTKKYFDGISANEFNIAKCKKFIRGEWAIALDRIKNIGFTACVGTSGTLTTLIGMAYLRKNEELPTVLNGVQVKAKHVLKVIQDIKEAGNPRAISQLNGMDPTRADIILAGALIVETAIEVLGIKKFLISTYALREGIFFDTVEKQYNLKQYHQLTKLRYKTVVGLAEKYGADIKHSEHILKLSTKIFDELSQLHGRGYYERELLEAASYLHDVGFHISHDKHHKHSFYLIKNSVMTGFTNNEAELIANIARYHRKSHPNRAHKSYNMLSLKNQETVWVLAGILRIAEGLDRRQIQNVDDIRLELSEHKLEITLISNGGEIPDIELWGADRRKAMLEEALGLEIIFK
jgi:exopolyphosphatase/guanosine-5'-triphosphate,3'-diphosphate pyrophosphatase